MPGDSFPLHFGDFTVIGSTADHTELANRDKPDQHPINAISGLREVLAGIPSKTSDLTNDSGFITDAEIPTKTSELINDSGFITDADVPTKTSDLTNDSGFITEADVPTKTSALINDSNFVADANYVHTDNNFTSADKIKMDSVQSGAEPNVQSDWNETNTTSDAFIKHKPSIPIKTSDLINDSGFITEADVPTKTSALINDSNFVSDSAYVHTDNNFTTVLKTKLTGIANGAEVNVQSDWNETSTASDAFIKNKPTIPSKTSDLTNDSGFITSGDIPTKTSDLINDSNFVSDANYIHTDNNYSNAEKTKLTNIETGAEANVQSDWNETSTASDAFIKNKPTIPSKTSDLTNDSDFVSDSAYVHTDKNFTAAEKTKLAGIAEGAEENVQSDWTATSGDAYIKNKPTIPAKVSDLTNDSGFVVAADVPSKTSDLTNDSGFITDADVPTKTSDLTNDSNFVSDTAYVHTDSNYTAAEKTKLAGIAAGAEENVQSDWNATSGDAFIKNKPTIPSKTSDLTNDSNFATESDIPTKVSELTNDLGFITIISVPTKTSDLTNDSNFVADSAYVHTDKNYTAAEKTKLEGVETGAEANVQSDWNATDTTADAFIKNKPKSYNATGTNIDGYMTQKAVTDALAALTGMDARVVTVLPTTGERGVIYLLSNGTSYDEYLWIEDLTNYTKIGTTDIDMSEYAKMDDLTDALVGKVDKVTGKGLSTNDYTTAEKTKLAGIAEGAEVNVQSDWNATSGSDAYIKNKPTIPYATSQLFNDANFAFEEDLPTKVSELTNDSGFITEADLPTKTSDLTNDSNFIVDADYVHTDNNFTTALRGKLSGIEAGAEVNVQSDWNETNTTSDAFIKNKPEIETYEDFTGATTAADGAHGLVPKPLKADKDKYLKGDGTWSAVSSGGGEQSDWNETDSASLAFIKNKPTIPTKVSDLTNDSEYIADSDYVHTDNNYTTTEKTKLAGIAEGAEENVQSDWNVTNTGSDAFIKNKPAIPSKTSDLTNDSDFVTSSDIPTKTSDLTNDSNFVVDADYVHTDNNFTTAEKAKLTNVESGAEANVQSDWNETDTSSDAYIKNKPTILTGPYAAADTDGGSALKALNLNDLTVGTSTKPIFFKNGVPQAGAYNLGRSVPADAVFTDTPADWNETDATSLAFIKNKPTIPVKTSDLTNDSDFVSDAAYIHTDANYTVTDKSKLAGIMSGAEPNVQSDWNETNTASDAYIKNKPTIPTGPYAAGDTDGGNALKALNLNDVTVGTNKRPIYFENGVPKVGLYYLAATVPADAVFTDTTYELATTTEDGLMPSYEFMTEDEIDTMQTLLESF